MPTSPRQCYGRTYGKGQRVYSAAPIQSGPEASVARCRSDQDNSGGGLGGSAGSGGPPSKPLIGQPVGAKSRDSCPSSKPSGCWWDKFQLESQELSYLDNKLAKQGILYPSPSLGFSPPLHERSQAGDCVIVRVQDKECPVCITSAAKSVGAAGQ